MNLDRLPKADPDPSDPKKSFSTQLRTSVKEELENLAIYLNCSMAEVIATALADLAKKEGVS